ncbi:hypothetical protein Poly24_17570 [Rosistilla carotiformis]|uniref:Uncharacterized protein n=1 Tax=Rosistilla carotiformis TaxID=2528017 RepID=A0A518JR76_9BACT|nr:hypothetical protein Poly24_17570 [Rosistilla carotiformis]
MRASKVFSLKFESMEDHTDAGYHLSSSRPTPIATRGHFYLFSGNAANQSKV